MFSQKPGDDYVFTSDVILERFNSFTNTIIVDAANIYKAKRGHVFRIQSAHTIGGVNGFCIVFWNFKKSATQIPPLAAVSYHTIDKTDNGIAYFVSAANLANMASSDFRKPRGIVKIDALVLPIKLRFKNKEAGSEFDFAQSISVGPAISFIHNHGGPFGKTSSSFLLGFNVTNVSVDEKTAPGVLESRTTLLGLSPFLGYNLNYQGINFGVLVGIDILTGKAGEVWSYRKSPWIGISIGASLSTPEKKKEVQ